MIFSVPVDFSICACHPCAGAMLVFPASLQFYRKLVDLCVPSLRRSHVDLLCIAPTLPEIPRGESRRIAGHPSAGAIRVFSVSFQFYRIFPEGNPWIHEKRQPQAWRLGASRWSLSVGVAVGASASLVVSALEAFASETPSGGLGDGVQRSSPCLAQHVDGITPRNQVVCKVAVMQIAAIWQLTTWGTAEAGNRASKTGRYLEWWDNGPECLAMTSGECKVHHNTLYGSLRVDRPQPPKSQAASPLPVGGQGLERAESHTRDDRQPVPRRFSFLSQ